MVIALVNGGGGGGGDTTTDDTTDDTDDTSTTSTTTSTDTFEPPRLTNCGAIRINGEPTREIQSNVFDLSVKAVVAAPDGGSITVTLSVGGNQIDSVSRFVSSPGQGFRLGGEVGPLQPGTYSVTMRDDRGNTENCGTLTIVGGVIEGNFDVQVGVESATPMLDVENPNEVPIDVTFTVTDNGTEVVSRVITVQAGETVTLEATVDIPVPEGEQIQHTICGEVTEATLA